MSIAQLCTTSHKRLSFRQLKHTYLQLIVILPVLPLICLAKARSLPAPPKLKRVDAQEIRKYNDLLIDQGNDHIMQDP